jgi:hypothetical protein
VDRRNQANWLIRAFGIFIVGLAFWILVALTLSSANAGPLSLLVDLSSKLKASYGIDLFGNSMGSLQLSIIEDVWMDGGGIPGDGGGPGDLVAGIIDLPVPTATLSDQDQRNLPTTQPTQTPGPTASPIFTATPASTPTATTSPTPTEVTDEAGGNTVEPTKTPSSTPTKTPSPTNMPTSTVTKTPKPTKTPLPPTKTPKPTHTDEPTLTPTEECTPTPVPSNTPLPSPTNTPASGTPSGPSTPAAITKFGKPPCL